MRNHKGFLFIDKHTGITSHDAVDAVRKKFRIRKVGLSGTLDPFASGLLIIGIGKATRLLEYFKVLDKEYNVKIKLGVITDTFDNTGKIVEERDTSSISEKDLKEAIESFKGEYMQVPPAYSAQRYKGERLYNLARQGNIINLPPRKVQIKHIRNIVFDSHEKTASFTVSVSSGTYVRSLVMDIGYKLGCGAHTTYLRRTRIGIFGVDNSKRIQDISDNDIIPPAEAMRFISAMYLTEESSKKVLNGSQIWLDDVAGIEGNFKKNELIRLISPSDEIVSMAKADVSSKFLRTLIRNNDKRRIAKLKKVIGEH
ncbi:MAG: tRNA pseudouridine(55) synthase TruB [Thermotogota bacterium]|nr:tRNA pseudouridine(55) synthase TruB [Thermotogota bacterium]